MSFGKRKIPKHLLIEDYQYKKRNGFGWLSFAAAILLLSMFISIYAKASAELHESQAGQLMFKGNDGRYQPSLHLSSSADVSISGLIAHVTLSQSFSNHTDQWQEGVYVFPLPENAAVNHMQMTIGERVIVGEIKEKHKAKAIYQKAKRAGKRATLSEQLRPNLFSHRVANIGPNQTVEIRITYIHTTTYKNGQFSWRLPMTITPRYFPKIFNAEAVALPKDKTKIEISKSSGWATSESQYLDMWPLPSSVNRFDAKSIFNPIDITISLNSGLPLAHIDALFHDVNINKNGKQHDIELAEKTVNMDRDFVLTWRPTASHLPQAALFTEEVDNNYYSLLMVLPPERENNQSTLARDIVFILDTSGSMQGKSIAQAKESLKQALSQLSHRDRFNIIAFNSHHTLYTKNLEYASEPNRQAAVAWIDQLRANGGTVMLPALTKAFGQFDDGENLQQTIFITDGAVGNEPVLFREITKKIGNSRLFTVGIGSAPNSYFMKKCAEYGRGTFTYVGDIKQVSEKIQSLFYKLSAAVAKDIQATWPNDDAEIYPRKIPDIYHSEPLLISAKSKELNGALLVEGVTAQSPWQQSVSLESHSLAKGVSTVWARAKIEALEDSKASGGDHSSLKQAITDIALSHRILSRYTSFIAVEQERSRSPEQRLSSTPVQNALPAGYNNRPLTPVNYPSSATNAEITWWFGLFCFVTAIVLRRLMKD